MHFGHLNFSVECFGLIFTQRQNPVTEDELQKVLISGKKAMVVMTAFSFSPPVADMSLLCNFT